mmetsp:Transcript_127603/g.318647  ORF Transcript_127603/g.318647 Transcript_127603/m.318647 type:complete len:235 (+) Transcript_127603:664-1368(+)
MGLGARWCRPRALRTPRAPRGLATAHRPRAPGREAVPVLRCVCSSCDVFRRESVAERDRLLLPRLCRGPGRLTVACVLHCGHYDCDRCDHGAPRLLIDPQGAPARAVADLQRPGLRRRRDVRLDTPRPGCRGIRHDHAASRVRLPRALASFRLGRHWLGGAAQWCIVAHKVPRGVVLGCLRLARAQEGPADSDLGVSGGRGGGRSRGRSREGGNKGGHDGACVQGAVSDCTVLP